MGKFTFVCKEHFGELVTFGCDQMAPQLWRTPINTPLDPIDYAILLEMQAAHIRECIQDKEKITLYLKTKHGSSNHWSHILDASGYAMVGIRIISKDHWRQELQCMVISICLVVFLMLSNYSVG